MRPIARTAHELPGPAILPALRIGAARGRIFARCLSLGFCRDRERVRVQVLTAIRRASTSPQEIAGERWWSAAFPDHPYGRQVRGTFESVPRISADDLKSYARRVFARANLKVGVVGDIDAETLGR